MSKMKKEKTDKQVFTKWIVIMVFAIFAGGIGGFFSKPVLEWFGAQTSGIEVNMELVFYLVFVLFVMMNVIGALITYLYYRKAKIMLEVWDGENENVLDTIENKLDVAILPITIVTSVNLFMFALNSYIGLDLMEDKRIVSAIITLIDAIVFIGFSLLFVALQKKCVDLTKRLNPEKQGNIFDKNFSKDWLASCDEAQQLLIYKASFKAYQSGISICHVLWLITLIGMLSFDTGLLPVFCVSFILLVMQLSYYMESKKLERGRR